MTKPHLIFIVFMALILASCQTNYDDYKVICSTIDQGANSILEESFDSGSATDNQLVAISSLLKDGSDRLCSVELYRSYGFSLHFNCTDRKSNFSNWYDDEFVLLKIMNEVNEVRFINFEQFMEDAEKPIALDTSWYYIRLKDYSE